jgi:hypothetical protein
MAIRLLAGATAAVCWTGLAIQFVLLLRTTTALAAVGEIEYPLVAAVAIFFLFLTFHINLLAAVVTAATAAGIRRFEQMGRVHGALITYMWAGSIVFIVALQPVWNHHGAQNVVDMLLHYAAPVLYTAYWLASAPKAVLRWRDPLIWLIYPLLYLAGMLAIAYHADFYPYPVFDPRMMSPSTLASNLAAVIVVFLAIGLAVVAAARAVEPAKA